MFPSSIPYKQFPPLLIPMAGSQIAAGFPSPALDYSEDPIDLMQIMVPHPTSTFYIKATGDSMIDAGIFPGSVLIVDRSLTAKSGDIVAAFLDGGYTVKYIEFGFNKCRLLPANKRKGYEPINVTEEMQMVVWGVVTVITTETKIVRQWLL